MKNLGIAKPKVEILNKLPNIDPYVKNINFDSSAYGWESMQNLPFHPLLTESIADPSGAFMALHPSKRIHWVDNYISGGLLDQLNLFNNEFYILWTPITLISDTILFEIIESENTAYNQYQLILPEDYDISLSDEYLGPVWSDDSHNRMPNPNDAAIIQRFLDIVNGSYNPNTNTESNETEINVDNNETIVEEIISINYVLQNKVLDGLWWGLESSAFISKDNMPFWVLINKKQQPTSSKNETFFVLSLGIADRKNRYDLVLSLNKKPQLIDYGFQENDNDNRVIKDFEQESTRLFDEKQNLVIGVMTVAGRLVFIVNGETLVYTRVDKSEENNGNLVECKIAAGTIRLYGSNVQCSINVSLMSFAQMALVPLRIPKKSNEMELEEETEYHYKGVKYDGSEFQSPLFLPTPPTENQQLYGCDCRLFHDENGDFYPNGFGFHKDGLISFLPADEETFSTLQDTDFYLLAMYPDDLPASDNVPYTVENQGCPYYFRLKGQYKKDLPEAEDIESTNITDNLIKLDETVTAPDYFHCIKKISLTCYDEDGDISNLLNKGQKGIRISWGWNNNLSQTFVGLVTNINTSSKAGEETVSITAEDYMHILKNTPIINSPFYDGMVAYYAIKDIAERASIKEFVNDWDDTDDYFLPAGFSFTKPVMRFDSDKMLFDCIIDIVKRFEAFVYFDEEGRFVLTKLPGGLFSENATSSYDFVSNNSESDYKKIILNQRDIEIDYNSTVNCISAMTVNRDTRNYIVYSVSADNQRNNLIFRKLMLYNQAALGSLEVCRGYIDRLSERVFYPVLKTRWKTAGANIDIEPLAFVTLDDHIFRITSVKRSFSADNNDSSTDYEGEWLGGQ